MDKFRTFLHRAKPDYTPPETLIALDPGETTGLAIFKHGQLVETKQLETHKVVPHGVDLLKPLIENNPDLLVYENYLVYDWKSKAHSWNTLHTPRLIGAVQAMCYIKNIPMYTQMAQQPKQFCTDDKLKSWDYYDKGMRHARDAVRHGAYYLLFNAHKDDNVLDN